MATRVIRESYGGGSIEVDATPRHAWIRIAGRGSESGGVVVLALTATELDELIAALQAAKAELADAGSVVTS